MNHFARCFPLPALAVLILALLLPYESTAQTLLARWQLDGNANDVSGNGHNGVAFGAMAPTDDRFGNANNAMNFNGGYLRVAPSSVFSPRTLTLTAWVRYCVPNNIGDWTIVGKPYTTGTSIVNSYSLGTTGISNSPMAG